MTVNHYENFPVASVLLPAKYRPAVRELYLFARSADDIADEGTADNAQRLAALDAYAAQLNKIDADVLPDEVQFVRLQTTLRVFELPTNPLYDLLSAFKQDVVKKRYATYAELLDYCARSANPVGTLILHLYKAATPQNLRDSDAICSALQLINFWQDVAIDWEKQRIYLPQEDMQRFAVSEQTIAQASANPAWQALMQFEVQRTRELMLSGSSLACRLPGRVGFELRLVVQGGLRILEKITQQHGDVFLHRPKLNRWDWLVLFWRACRM